VDVSTGRRSAESATPAASAAASRVVHRDSYVCPAKNSRGRQNRAVIGAGKTAHGWREREKHLIFPQAVKQRAGGQPVVESLPFSKSKTKSDVESSSRAEFR
jgi:hypothetical protein